MPDVALVVSPGQGPAVHELGSTLAYELERQDMPATVHVGSFPESRVDRVHVLLDPVGYVAAEGLAALPGARALARSVFVCPELAPLAEEDDPAVDLLSRAGAVFAQDRRDVVALHRVGIPARLLRPGYSQSTDHYADSPERPIDIVALGPATERRASALAEAAPVLARRECHLELADPALPDSVLGPDRWPLLARAKIALIVNPADGTRAQFGAILDAIHAGAVPVAEHGAGLAPLDPGEHLLVASASALPYVADRLLNNPDRLALIQQTAYERLSSWIPYALPVSVLRAAIVELVGEPLPDDADAQPFAEDRGDGSGRRRPAAPEADHRAGQPPPARASALAAAGIADSPAWAASAGADVTVICVLDGDADSLERTLDSVAASYGAALELIAVHDPDDPSAGALERWCDAHPRLSSRRIALKRPADRAAARRAAALVARAPSALLIEPGHELYPRGPALLSAALNADAATAFTFPLVEIRGPKGAGSRLANLPGEDPAGGPVVLPTAILRAGADPGHTGAGRRVAQILARRAAA